MQREDGVLRLEGALDQHTVGRLFQDSRRLFAASPPASVDLAALQHVDSAGLALLLEWQAWARRAGRTLTLRHAPAPLLQLARLSELDELLPLEGTA
jgi:phospholipid transport system transporter-binding protein